MKRIIVLLTFLLTPACAFAQSLTPVVVSACGTPPQTYHAGQSYPMTMDTTGTLCATGSGGGGASSVNIASVNGVALGSPSAYGTSPGAVAVPGVNAFVTNPVAVTGTFWQATQPVSLSALPALPTGANVIGGVTQSGTWTVGLTGTLPAFAATPTVNVGTMPSVAVTGTFWQATQPVSAASLPLPSGAATSANQPALNGDGGALAHVTNPVTSVTSGAITNPTSTLTSGTATAITATNNEIASSTTAGSIVVPSFSIATSAGGAIIPKLTMQTSATSGWGGASIQIDLWRAAPTLTNGDGAAYLPATGSASYVGSYTCTLAQAGDGAYGECTPNVGQADFPKLAGGASVYWTAFSLSTVAKVSGQTFVLTAAVLN